jgi:hypothetical protein
MLTKTKNALNMKATLVGSCIRNEIRRAIREKSQNKLEQKRGFFVEGAKIFGSRTCKSKSVDNHCLGEKLQQKKLKNKNSVLRQIHNLSLGRFVELKVELSCSPRCEQIALRSSELYCAASPMPSCKFVTIIVMKSRTIVGAT